MTWAGGFREQVLRHVEQLFKLLEILIENKLSLKQVLFSSAVSIELFAFFCPLFLTFSESYCMKRQQLKFIRAS